MKAIPRLMTAGAVVLSFATAGCELAFTCSRVDIQEWEVDTETNLATNHHVSYCSISKNPRYNYNKYGVSIVSRDGTPIVHSVIEGSPYEDDLPFGPHELEARADSARRLIWLVDPKNGQIITVRWTPNSLDMNVSNPNAAASQPTEGVPLKRIDANL
jgi:hypothetical protein